MKNKYPQESDDEDEVSLDNLETLPVDDGEPRPGLIGEKVKYAWCGLVGFSVLALQTWLSYMDWVYSGEVVKTLLSYRLRFPIPHTAGWAVAVFSGLLIVVDFYTKNKKGGE